MSSIPFGDWKPLCSNEFLHFDGSDEQNGFCKFQGQFSFCMMFDVSCTVAWKVFT